MKTFGIAKSVVFLSLPFLVITEPTFGIDVVNPTIGPASSYNYVNANDIKGRLYIKNVIDCTVKNTGTIIENGESTTKRAVDYSNTASIGTLSLENSGAIKSYNGDAIYVSGGALTSLTNNSGSEIYGKATAINARNGIGTLINDSASITSDKYSVYVYTGNFLSLTNTNDALIQGLDVGIFVLSGDIGTLTNTSSSIIGKTSFGIDVRNGASDGHGNIGKLVNESGGLIFGTVTAISAWGGIPELVNDASEIIGAGSFGIITRGDVGDLQNINDSVIHGKGTGLNVGGSITTKLTNTDSEISGDSTGIAVTGDVKQLVNDNSTIEGGLASGIGIGGVLTSLVNENGSVISGGNIAVSATKGIESLINNASTITGTAKYGIRVASGNLNILSNENNAVISGGSIGIYITGDIKEITNDNSRIEGLSSGDGSYGIWASEKIEILVNKETGVISGGNTGVFGTIGDLTNNIDSTIQGGRTGVTSRTGGNITNYSAITGNTENGICIKDGDALITNDDTGTIFGGQSGILMEYGANLTLSNSGSIEGGIGLNLLNGTHSITNTRNALIEGNLGAAISIYGGDGTVIDNTGDITSLTIDGILIQGGSFHEITNHAEGHISGGGSAISINNSDETTITNEGTLTGNGGNAVELKVAATRTVVNITTESVEDGYLRSELGNENMIRLTGAGDKNFHNVTGIWGSIEKANLGRSTLDEGYSITLNGRDGTGLDIQAGLMFIDGTVNAQNTRSYVRNGASLDGTGLFNSHVIFDKTSTFLVDLDKAVPGNHMVIGSGSLNGIISLYGYTRNDEFTSSSKIVLLESIDQMTGSFDIIQGQKVLVGNYIFTMDYSSNLVQLIGAEKLPDDNIPPPASNTGNMVASGRIGWFMQNSNIHKRMGELRLMPNDETKHHFWTRGYGAQARINMDMAGIATSDTYLYGGDLGVDRKYTLSNGTPLYLGLFGGYQRIDNNIRDTFGSNSDIDSLYGGLYGTWLGKDGWFTDIVAKLHDYDTKLTSRQWTGSERASYSTWAGGLSIEAGKRELLKDNRFREWSGQVSWMGQPGVDYYTDKGTQTRISSSNVWEFEAKIRYGKSYKYNCAILQPFVKAGIMEQVSSGGDVSFSNTPYAWRMNADGLNAYIGTGVMWQCHQHQIHLDYEASWGEKTIIPWRANLGYTLTF